MVFPIFPIVVYDKLFATGVTMIVVNSFYIYRNIHFDPTGYFPVVTRFVGSFITAVFLLGFYLRFYYISPDDIGKRDQQTGNLLRDQMSTTKESYERRKKQVEVVAKEICRDKSGKFRMFKQTASNTFRHDQIDTRASKEGKLDLSSFCHVIDETLDPVVSEDSRNSGEEDPNSFYSPYHATIEVEASTTFETFVSVLLEKGYMPLVVPELRSITVGGAIVGIGVESSSFKHGFFHEGLVAADILLPFDNEEEEENEEKKTGAGGSRGSGLSGARVVTVTKDNEYRDLFAALPNSLGSFGYILKLKMRVQKVKPYVRLTKTWVSGADNLVKALEIASTGKSLEKSDFVDCVALSTTGGVIIEARFVDRPEQCGSLALSDYSWRSGKSFYKSLFPKTDPKTGNPPSIVTTDLLTVEDYIWRWDADWFWCTQIFPGLQFQFIRYLCGPRLLRSDMYKVFNDKFTRLLAKIFPKAQENQELVIQDIEVPVENSAHWLREHCRIVRSDLFGKIKLNSDYNVAETTTTDLPCKLEIIGGTTATSSTPNVIESGQTLLAADVEDDENKPATSGANMMRERKIMKESTSTTTCSTTPLKNPPRPLFPFHQQQQIKRTTRPDTVPIWLCPVRGTSAPLMPMDENKLYINFGFWDALEDTTTRPKERCTTLGGNQAGNVNRGLEAICDENAAIKTLYSTCYYTEEEFYQKYNGEHYKKIKEKYDGNGRLRSWFARVRGS
ncbi:unnamed protein product [Amoebophrya sp. A120]|nr:unnamed protein product [Amoebophrya sp. A120]|eukprot:GSA120T00008437001.1